MGSAHDIVSAAPAVGNGLRIQRARSDPALTPGSAIVRACRRRQSDRLPANRMIGMIQP